MNTGWFRLDHFYESVGDKDVFYPHLYARGYRMSAEQRATMDGVLGPFLSGRLRIEFAAIFILVSFLLTVAAGGFLLTASREELEMYLATPKWVFLAGAVVFAAVIVAPIVARIQLTIRRQLDEMGLEPNEPPRPDFFVVDGAFSWQRMSCALLALAVVLTLIANIVPAVASPVGH